jgi:hypothetical protein
MSKNPLGMLKEGVKNPSKVPQFLKRKKSGAEIRLRNFTKESQKSKIHDLLDEKEFLLIILDACRYDIFKQEYGSHFSGEFSKTYSTNTYTMQYLVNTWTDTYDITYVAGGPVISDQNFEISEWGYRPTEHFEKVVDVWNRDYGKELGVTPPEKVTEAAMNEDSPRMVVHYFQPHAPYIGEKRLREETSRERDESLKDIYGRIDSGEISQEDLRGAYVSNLRRVIEAVKPLVDSVNGKSIITSDHGELLGEDKRFMHGGVPHKNLCELPWLTVEDTKGDYGSPDIETPENGQSKQVEEQLKDLGYL